MKRLLIVSLLNIFFLLACERNNSPQIKEIEYSNNKIVEPIKDSTDKKIVYVAVSTMISPVETFDLYKDLIDYIAKKLDVKIEFKQRKSYAEVNDLLKEKKLDFAFICTGAYLEARSFPIEILVVPVVNGKPFYNAFIIVNKNSEIKTFEDLKNHSFAFTDPLSNTGYAYVVNKLKSKNTTPDKFFSKTTFTYAHDYSIQAVQRNLVDGASVDGLVFDYLKKNQPAKVENISVIHKSEDYGIPPFVVQPDMDKTLKEKLKNVMLNLHNDEEGKYLLQKIMIDKFIPGDDSNYLR